jgi:hypothetical protein
MKKIAELTRQQLKWVQPGMFKTHYELRAGDEIAATLRFRSSFGTLATGQSADGCWTFKRVGFLQTRVTIRECDRETDTAVFRNTWSGGGTLELSGGRKLQANTSLWQSKIEFKKETGETMLLFNRGGVIHPSAEVVIEPEADKMAELPWLLMLGWYLTVMLDMDTAAIVAAIG